MPELLTIRAIAKRLKCQPRSVYGMLKTRTVNAVPTDEFCREAVNGPMSRLYRYTPGATDAKAVLESVRTEAVAAMITGADVIQVTEMTIVLSLVYRVNPVAFAVAAALGRQITEVIALRDDHTSSSSRPLTCAAGYRSNWVSVPLPGNARRMMHELQRCGTIFPFSFRLELPVKGLAPKL